MGCTHMGNGHDIIQKKEKFSKSLYRYINPCRSPVYVHSRKRQGIMRRALALFSIATETVISTARAPPVVDKTADLVDNCDLVIEENIDSLVVTNIQNSVSGSFGRLDPGASVCWIMDQISPKNSSGQTKKVEMNDMRRYVAVD